MLIPGVIISIHPDIAEENKNFAFQMDFAKVSALSGTHKTIAEIS